MTQITDLAAENEVLLRQLAWCLPRLSRDRYREALQSFLAARGVSLPLPARDEPRMVQS